MKIRTLKKLDIDEMAKRFPVLTREENMSIVAGSGTYLGDRVYNVDDYLEMIASGTWNGGFVGNSENPVYIYKELVITTSGSKNQTAATTQLPDCGAYKLPDCGAYGSFMSEIERELQNYGRDLDSAIESAIKDLQNQGLSPYQLSTSEITAAAQAAVKAVKDTYGTEVACCNIGVNNAFMALFDNNTSLSGKQATGMIDYWRSSSDWIAITGNVTKITNDTEAKQLGSVAQQFANNGWFVVGGWYNSGNSHVVVVVPNSNPGTWPSCMDTGGNKRYESNSLDYCLGGDKKHSIEYFRYNPGQ
jgi:hypothetical protein